MNIIRYPAREDWQKILSRPHLDVTELNETVASVLNDVRLRGDDFNGKEENACMKHC